jgi:hypothetical protein
LGGFDPIDVGEAPAGREHRALKGREIILRVSIGEAEGDIGVATPGNMRNPVAVADDRRIVFGGGRDRRLGVEPCQPRLMRRKETEKSQGGERDDGEDTAQDHDLDARLFDRN